MVATETSKDEFPRMEPSRALAIQKATDFQGLRIFIGKHLIFVTEKV